MILGAAYTLWMYKRVIYGAVANDHVAALTDVNRREFWLLGVGRGRWCSGWACSRKPFIDVMHASVARSAARTSRSSKL